MNGNFESIFDQLDSEKCGFISVHAFKEILQSFYSKSISQSEEGDGHVDDIIAILDPQKDGKIYFEDFKLGLQKLFETSGMDVPNNVEGPPEFLKSSQETLVDSVSTPAEECDTNDRYQNEGDDSGVHSVGHEDPMSVVRQFDRAISQHDESDSLDPGSESENWAQGEEAFEDYGSVESNILIDLSSPPPELQRKPPPHPDSSNHLNPNLERGSEVRGTWPRRRASLARPPSANQLAHELHSSSGRASPNTRTSGDGMYFDDGMDSDSHELAMAYQEDLSNQLRSLTSTVELLSSSQAQSDSIQGRLRDENQHLTDRIHRLEDEYRDAEVRHREEREEEKRKFKDKLHKLTKEKDSENEELIEKLRLFETSSAEHRLEAARYKSESERLKLENARLEEKLEHSDSRISSFKEETERYKEVTKRELEAVKKERDHAQQLLEELNREVEGFRETGVVSGGRDRSSSTAELISRYREVEQLVKRLTSENKGLREQLEETQAELLTRGLEEGQALLRKHGMDGVSLASELESMTKDEVECDEESTMSQSSLLSRRNFDPAWQSLGRWELMDILVKEKDANEKLRSYVDRILLRIMEKQPELLEVGNGIIH